MKSTPEDCCVPDERYTNDRDYSMEADDNQPVIRPYSYQDEANNVKKTNMDGLTLRQPL